MATGKTKDVSLTDAEIKALQTAAGFLLAGAPEEVISGKQVSALNAAQDKLQRAIRPSPRLPAKLRAEIIDDLKKLNGLPPYAGGGNFVRGDGYFANSLVSKYGMSLSGMEKASGFDEVRRKVGNLMKQAARVTK